MEVIEYARLEIGDASAAGHARRLALDLARSLEFDEAAAGRVGIVVNEAASNLVKHAGDGELLLRTLSENGTRGVGLLALDRGPGFANLGEAMRDGFSSSGTPGTGLGAIRRLSTFFDLHSTQGVGTALLAAIWPVNVPDANGMLVGGINVPYPGEFLSGDAWALASTPERIVVLVSDGLGHGAPAAEASAAAAATFRRHAAHPPAHILQRMHEALRSTRGAAVAVAEIDRGRGVLRFAGLGNIGGTIVDEGHTRSLVSQHGTAGHDVRTIQEFTYSWPAGALLVLHSDGLISHFTLDRYPGIARRHPMLVAGVLYRDFRRGRDDVSVVVVREAG